MAYLLGSNDQVVPTRPPSRSSFLINRHHSHTEYIQCLIYQRMCHGAAAQVGEITHNVNELLHFTLAFRLNFSHLQRYKRAKLISLYFRLVGGQDRAQAHICKYLGCKCFPNLPEDLAPFWCGDVTDVPVSLPRLIEGLMQLFGGCLHVLDGN